MSCRGDSKYVEIYVIRVVSRRILDVSVTGCAFRDESWA